MRERPIHAKGGCTLAQAVGATELFLLEAQSVPHKASSSERPWCRDCTRLGTMLRSGTGLRQCERKRVPDSPTKGL